jgi:hypothetical protein
MAYMTQKEGKAIPDARRSIPRACKRSQASQPPSRDCFLNRNVKAFAAKDEPDADANVQASISKAKHNQDARDKKIAIAQNRAASKERKRIQDERDRRERQRIKDAHDLCREFGKIQYCPEEQRRHAEWWQQQLQQRQVQPLLQQQQQQPLQQQQFLQQRRQ